MKGIKTIILSLIAATLTAALWPGCTKVDTDVAYDIKAYLRLPDVDSAIWYNEYVEIFAFHDVDTADFWVRSYEDAGRGIITNKDDPSDTRGPEQNIAELSADGSRIHIGSFTGGKVMLVAYDPESHGKYDSKMYAWRQIAIEPGVGRVTIGLYFNPEKRGDILAGRNTDSNPDSRVYTETKWYVANDNPWVEPDS
ncbi:MAG: hypothetical protein LIO77_06325 [Rikenellaceae bacterium]|nr:hypothetical protein [Rikenellaceae bacterium]